ncbi:hypothetical protein ACOQJ6_32405, partial [Klebsiella pneumoniae]|uniref:hypothetical protein n=2 Tax=Gammaproteobacteria TaxID=1236 RepID=UPI0030190CAF
NMLVSTTPGLAGKLNAGQNIAFISAHRYICVIPVCLKTGSSSSVIHFACQSGVYSVFIPVTREWSGLHM